MTKLEHPDLFGDASPIRDRRANQQAASRRCYFRDGKTWKSRSPQKRQDERKRRADKLGVAYYPRGAKPKQPKQPKHCSVCNELKQPSEFPTTGKRCRSCGQAAYVVAVEKSRSNKPWCAPDLSPAQRYRMRYAVDPDFIVKERLRASFRRKRQGKKLGDLLRMACARNGEAPSVEAFVGYKASQLRTHLELQFKGRMSWANFSKIDIDHIIPLSSFDLSNPDELQRAWALTNLRPMWAKANKEKAAQRLHLL